VVEAEHETEVARNALEYTPPATSLLDGGSDALDHFESGNLAEDWPLASWDEVAGAAGSHNILGLAHVIGSDLERLNLADTSLGGVVSVIEHQDNPGSPRFAALLTCDSDEEAVGPLATILTAALIEAGQAHFVSDWTDVLLLKDSRGGPLDPDELARKAITEPSAAKSLRAWLTEHHVNLDGPVGRQDRSHPDWLAAVSHVTGPWGKDRYDVHVWTTGLLAMPIDRATLKADKAAYTTSHQRDRLMQEARDGTESGRALPGAVWIDRADIVGGEMSSGLVRMTIRMKLASGAVQQLRSAVESELVDGPEAVGSAFGYLLSIPIETPPETARSEEMPTGT